MTLRRLAAILVVLLPCGPRPHVHAQSPVVVTMTLSEDIPTRTRAPFSLDGRERRPTAAPGPPISAEDAEALGCQALSNGWVICPPGTGTMRGRRVARPRPGPYAMQDTLPPPPAPGDETTPPPVTPTAPPPQRPQPRYLPPPQQFAWPPSKGMPAQVAPQQVVPYASPQAPSTYTSPQAPSTYTSPQTAIYDWEPDEVDRFSVERYHGFRPVRAAGYGTSIRPDFTGWTVVGPDCPCPCPCR